MVTLAFFVLVLLGVAALGAFILRHPLDVVPVDTTSAEVVGLENRLVELAELTCRLADACVVIGERLEDTSRVAREALRRIMLSERHMGAVLLQADEKSWHDVAIQLGADLKVSVDQLAAEVAALSTSHGNHLARYHGEE